MSSYEVMTFSASLGPRAGGEFISGAPILGKAKIVDGFEIIGE